jgi:predicted PurR-regulated permease PerM
MAYSGKSRRLFQEPFVESQPALVAQRRLVLALSLGVLALLSFRVLFIFLVPVAWAGILAYVSWPLYEQLRRWLSPRERLGALIMTTLMAIILIVPLVWVGVMLKTELGLLYQKMAQRVGQGPIVLSSGLHDIPGLGAMIEDFINGIIQDSGSLTAQLKVWGNMGLNHIGGIADVVGKNLAKMVLAIFTLFFVYRDGENVVEQLRIVLRRVLGARVDGYIKAMGDTTRAVVWGLGLTALVQGVLAALGYWVAGVPSPVFLGALTMIIALVPFGPILAWGGVCLWLLVDGDYWACLGLFAWAVVVVSWVDNIVRPLVISNATSIPFLLVLFGVLGGLAAFGMIGLFLGPVILAVAMSVWREWLADATQAAASE